MAYTNSGLVKHCKEALKLKTVYMWGGLFREVTQEYINQVSGIKVFAAWLFYPRPSHREAWAGRMPAYAVKK